MCATPFEDCRASLCCQPLAFYHGQRDVGFDCMRRPHAYYAQCRPHEEGLAVATAGRVDAREALGKWCYELPVANFTCERYYTRASTDGRTIHVNMCISEPGEPTCRADRRKPECTDSDKWLCPGWERCVGAFADCTHSRCCADEGYSCLLNASALDAGEGWQASCQPKMKAGNFGEVTCADDKWLCPSKWMAHVHEAVEVAEWYTAEEPAEAAAAGLLVMVAGATIPLLCCLVHRRKVEKELRAQLGKIEQELGAVREQRRDDALKASGEGEGEQLGSRA